MSILIVFLFSLISTSINIMAFIFLIKGIPPKRKLDDEPLSICFLHPNLGHGGAEKFVVETGVALQNAGHHVEIYTGYHDKEKTFIETIDGTLDVHVHGMFLPRSIFGRFTLPCVIFKSFWIVIRAIMRHRDRPFDIIFIDQLPAIIPIFEISGIKTVFYCHYPDKLLSSHKTLIQRIYRIPLDWYEEKTTGKADCIIVNSYFTLDVFKRNFKSLRDYPIEVLYPCIDPSRIQGVIESGPPFILSINRFERKKNIELAIDAFSIVLKKNPDLSSLKLYIAGGYDIYVAENVEYLEELKKKAIEAKISNNVNFLLSISDYERNKLLANCEMLLYTPQNEHFGIGPIEAGVLKKPVLACNTGGPLETIIDKETGFLIEPDPELWAETITQLLRNPDKAKNMGELASRHVRNNFTTDLIIPKLEKILRNLVAKYE